jgi:hypothetical protein
MIDGKKEKAQQTTFVTASAILISLSTGFSTVIGSAIGTGFTTAALAESAGKKAEEAEFDSARQVFESYKKLDLASDPKLIDLYAPDAKIESDVERKDTPTQKEKYDREKYCALISKTFANPGLAKISATTVYDTPSISRELLDKDAVKVEFRAYQGDTAMKVNWILHKSESGQWLIAKEHAVTYRKSVGQAGQGSQGDQGSKSDQGSKGSKSNQSDQGSKGSKSKP